MSRKFALFLILAVALSGCETPKKGTVIARYPGGTVTDVEFNERVEKLPKELRAVVLRKKKEFAEELVNERFLIEEAKRRNLQAQPDVRALLRSAREKILTSKLLELEVDKKVKLETGEAEAHYEQHKDQYVTPLRVHAAQILVGTEAEARAALAQIRAGADFADVARRVSTDPTASKGGDLGFFQKGQVIQEFEDKAFSMKPGDVSEPFKTKFGWHVMQLIERIEPSARDLATMKPLIERQLIAQKHARYFKEFTEKLKAGKKITIDEKALDALAPAGSET